MNSTVETRMRDIVVLCKQYRVGKLEIFGSAAMGTFMPDKSDLDFLVEFQSMQPEEHADAYFGLLESLEVLFRRSIDLVETKAIRNPYFLASVNTSRKLLYAA